MPDTPAPQGQVRTKHAASPSWGAPPTAPRKTPAHVGRWGESEVLSLSLSPSTRSAAVMPAFPIWELVFELQGQRKAGVVGTALWWPLCAWH